MPDLHDYFFVSIDQYCTLCWPALFGRSYAQRSAGYVTKLQRIAPKIASDQQAAHGEVHNHFTVPIATMHHALPLDCPARCADLLIVVH
jgi:hypothetical protein